MNKLRLFLIVPLVVFAISAHAAKAVKTNSVHAPNPPPDHSVQTIMNYADWLKLKTADKEIYIIGIQKLMQDLEQRDLRDHTEYQSASRGPVYLNWIVPSADAAGETKRCVYAGWVSEMDTVGRYCKHPEFCGGEPRKLQCNPLIYGDGVCTKPGKSATSFCTQSAKSPAEIAKEIQAKGADGAAKWATFQSDLSGYCASPRPTQKVVCGMIQTRMLQLQRIVGKGKPVPAQSSTGDADAAAPAAKEKPRKTTVVVEPIVPTNPSLPRNSSLPLDPTKPAPAPPTATGDCDLPALVGAMNYNGEDARGWDFMDLEDAQTLMCQRDAIPAEWYHRIRDRAEARMKSAPASDKWEKVRKDDLRILLTNFDACYRDAVKLRKDKAPETFGNDAAIGFQPGGFISMTIGSEVIAVPGGASSSYIEGLLKAHGVSLCNVRISDPSGVRADSAGNGQRGAGGSSGAQ